MKIIIIILAIIVSSTNIKSQKLNIKQDSWNHIGMSFIVSGASTAQFYGWTQQRWLSTFIGFGITVTGGALWENYNKNNGGYFSKRDLKNDIIGAVIGTSVSHLIILGPNGIKENMLNRRIKRWKKRTNKNN